LEKRSGEEVVEEEMEVSIATPPECAESVDDGKIRVAGRREEEEDELEAWADHYIVDWLAARALTRWGQEGGAGRLSTAPP
jgi:hypothetical protein